MRKLNTDVLVVGGGATGLGVLRDLAMRGFDALLVEQRDLSHGTSGRYHGLLHSGARYVVKDPRAAVECIEENRILRRIMPHCIEDTGGLFVLTPWDDPGYVDGFIGGCADAGIPCEDVAISEMLAAEPSLNPAISQCFRVPDASADSFLGGESIAASARDHGATVLNYHRVDSLIRDGDQVVGARCHDMVADEIVEISAEMVVNAAGPWAGIVAATANVHLEVMAGKGTMLAFNHRVVHTVVNRLKMPDDGDILVPIRTVSVMGSTDERVADPGQFSIEEWEVRLLLEEAEKLVPGMSDMRVLRAWAGVRPLYQESGSEQTRDMTRAYALLDHAQRDGVEGFVTITGGKWTTFRQMAEVCVDRVCEKLDVEAPCTTHIEELPDTRVDKTFLTLGGRLGEVEQAQSYGDLICECELVTRQSVETVIADGDAKTIDDVRRDARLGMGPCQGGWCTGRVAGLFHDLRDQPVTQTNVSLRDFLQERWKGLVPILWGSQLQQERLDELIYLSLLNVESLPGPSISPLGPEAYDPPENR